MTFTEAMNAQSPWLVVWMNIMMVTIFILPLALLIWKSTRVTALIIVAANILNGILVTLLYNSLGYVKLLGLPHLFIWGPLAIYLWTILRRDFPRIPKIIIAAALITLVISLAFDLADTIRYVLGERTPTILPA